jgi:DNA-binding NtrC family response regulator
MRDDTVPRLQQNRRRSQTSSDVLPSGVRALGGAVVHSTLMREVLDLVARVAPSDASVLLTGESGVGKEVVARAIHQLSPRAAQEFVAINCASLLGETLENELFGHEKGAFTSADTQKLGVFEVADGGTLFLDEINEMGATCQAKILRALERREFRRLGGTRKLRVDVRIVAANNADLSEAVRLRRFREDLYYRLNVIHIHIPPLRERREAIPLMAQQFLQEFSDKYRTRSRRFADTVLDRFSQYAWPGNVRELRNVVESLVLTARGEQIGLRDLPATIRASAQTNEIRLPIGITLQDAEKEIVRRYLEIYPTRKEVAKVLDIGLRTLQAKIKAYGLPLRRASNEASLRAKTARGDAPISTKRAKSACFYLY